MKGNKVIITSLILIFEILFYIIVSGRGVELGSLDDVRNVVSGFLKDTVITRVRRIRCSRVESFSMAILFRHR